MSPAPAHSEPVARRHLLIVSSPFTKMTGADRDFVTLCNALDPARFRVTWAGTMGCEYLRPHLDPRVVERIVGFAVPVFHQLIQEQAPLPRGPWLWTKIILRELQHNWRASGELAALTRRDPPDLVITNSAALPVGGLYAQRIRRPHLWAVKEWFDPGHTSSRRFCRIMLRASRFVTVPSRACAAAFPRDHPKLRTVPDGNDIAAIESGALRRSRDVVLAELGLPPHLPLVTQVGAFQRWKGQHLTLEAVAEIAARHPDPTFSLIFLGGGSPEDTARLETQIADLPAPWRALIRHIRFEPDDFSWLRAADFVVHPSILPDPLPNAVREAMILGKAVIGPAEGGLLDLIESEKTGLLVPPRDAKALAAAMERLVGSTMERERMGTAARGWATEALDIRRRVKEWEELITGPELFLGKTSPGGTSRPLSAQ